ncbi:hypothetical protein RIF29_27194 [Crotalaria pallida]|uniref:Bet v I/Major latex protein domain-containing protein n=1 Tax=Crotalaria pallida TaxID=3830 RepID=A0AAN9ETJ1_CROPI
MALTGKLSIELGIQATAAKWYHLYTTQLHHVQNVAEKVHQINLHQGDDWHAIGSVKNWTYVIDGNVVSCKETVEAIDESNKTITYKLSDGDISQHYKVFKLIFQLIEREDGSDFLKWTVEYETINENVEPPYGYLRTLNECTKDIDGHLLKA